MPKNRIFREILAVFLLATVASACGSAGNPSADPADYIPAEINGQKVDQNSELAESLEDSIAGDDVESTASGSVGEPTEERPLPDVVVVAAKGKNAGIEATESQLQDTFGTGANAEEVDVDGVEVQVMGFNQQSLDASVAVAQIGDRTALIAFAFEGGNDAAVDAMRSMIDASAA